MLLPTRRAADRRPIVEADIGVGDRVLARITELEEADVDGYRFEASPIKRCRARSAGSSASSASPQERRRHDRADRSQAVALWSIAKGDDGPAKDGDLVRFDLARKGRFHVPQARVLEALGNPDDQRQISLIAVHSHGIPDDFPESVIAESEALKPPTLAGRTDLRSVPLVTIDPPDARDHDDAVYAEPDTDPANAGGWVVLVAIADVAHFVRPGTQARPRGAAARQLGLLPRPRRADAAGAHLQRPMLAARRREPRLPRRAHDLRPERQQAQPRLHARHDAFGREAHLPGSAGGHRRAPVRQGRPLLDRRAEAAVGRLRGGGGGARQAPAARPRPAGAQDRARRARAASRTS